MKTNSGVSVVGKSTKRTRVFSIFAVSSSDFHKTPTLHRLLFTACVCVYFSVRECVRGRFVKIWERWMCACKICENFKRGECVFLVPSPPFPSAPLSLWLCICIYVVRFYELCGIEKEDGYFLSLRAAPLCIFFLLFFLFFLSVSPVYIK